MLRDQRALRFSSYTIHKPQQCREKLGIEFCTKYAYGNSTHFLLLHDHDVIILFCKYVTSYKQFSSFAEYSCQPAISGHDCRSSVFLAGRKQAMPSCDVL